MRIGVVVEYLHGRGGTQRQALELARALKDAGEDVVVLTRVLDRARCFPELLEGLEVRAVREQREVPAAVQSSDLRALARLTTQRLGVHDVVALRAMRQATRELAELITAVNAEQPFDVLNAHDYGPAAWAVAAAPRHIGKVWQCNDPVFRWGKPDGPLGAVTRSMAIAYDRRKSAGFDVITVLDTRVARVVAERFGMEPRVVRSGVNAEAFARLPPRDAARARLGVPRDAFVVLALTLLNSPHRRAEDGIALIEELPTNMRLLFAATVTDESSAYTRTVTERVAHSPAAARIHWRSKALAGEDELRALFAAADVFLFPNVQQTWGLAVLEACMAGLPVVVSDGAGASEVLDHGETGFVYPAGDLTQARAHIERLEQDPELRTAVARAGRELARTLSWKRYAEEMLKAFADAYAHVRST